MSVSAPTPPDASHKRQLPWQFPNRTEQSAAERHRDSAESYLAVPWATHIDLGVPWVPDQRTTSHATRRGQKLHTVCQHVYWDEAAPYWTAAGVTDVWLSHAADTGVRPGRRRSVANLQDYPWRIHAWPLYAVKVEDPSRYNGVVVRKAPQDRRYLASFVGAHMPHYISDSRLRLHDLRNHPHFYIHLTGSLWNIPNSTYCGEQKAQHCALLSPPAYYSQHYNHILTESIFALCPAGAGRNTLRLWEALAVGAIPVLLDAAPAMPMIKHLAGPSWGDIIIQLRPTDISDLPRILRSISAREILRRHRNAISAYDAIRHIKCCHSTTPQSASLAP